MRIQMAWLENQNNVRCASSATRCNGTWPVAGPDTGDGGQSDGPRVECVHSYGRIGSRLLGSFIAKRDERHGLAVGQMSLSSAW